MRKIRDALRLEASGLTRRQLAASLSIGRTAARTYLDRAHAAGLSWPLPDGLSDEALERLLFAPPGKDPNDQRAEPNWPRLHLELRKPNVTLSLLWEEYRAIHPSGYGYSRFCDLYRTWKGRLTPTMRQNHVAGEKMFVDYAGATLEVIDGTSGEVLQAQVFVAVLGASNYTYAEATWSQTLPDWIGSHCRAFASTTSSLASPRPASMSLGSTAAMPRWRPITPPR
jgi:transposase